MAQAVADITDVSDATLAAQGDADAFERLYREHAARVNTLARRMLGGEDADEVASDVPDDTWVAASAIAATTLLLTGALLFTAGAVLAAWPLWAAGLALFAGGFVLFRP